MSDADGAADVLAENDAGKTIDGVVRHLEDFLFSLELDYDSDSDFEIVSDDDEDEEEEDMLENGR